MTYWHFREQLSRQDKLRRSIYEILRDELNQYLIEYGLVDSYSRFLRHGIPYPFVEKRELKPRARIPDVEYECHSGFLVIFVEEFIPNAYKKYIRFFDDNKVTKENLLRSKVVRLSKKYFTNIKLFESVHFPDFLKGLLPADYALLIQRDHSVKTRTRYGLSHFRVRIDWSIAEAAEDLARELRYVSKSLYENGENYAEEFQKKFFEYYGLPSAPGGRRTAAVLAAQFLRRVPCISTVYVASCESRGLYTISERGVSKYILLELTDRDVQQIAERHNLEAGSFEKNYFIAKQGGGGIVVFQTTYERTSHARPPEDGKLRKLNTEYSWLTVADQSIVPKAGVWNKPPLPYSIIYT
ncbi:MAG: hypothetical protein SWH78_14895 [Thermodesulfobacteriota bacterium]|nr:hypothetical protein [Thermodesulfobacteriota bacterium]